MREDFFKSLKHLKEGQIGRLPFVSIDFAVFHCLAIGFVIFNFLIMLPGCGGSLAGSGGSVQQRVISDVRRPKTAFTYDWPFSSIVQTQYSISDATKLEFAGSICKLKEINQNDSEATELISGTFSAGSNFGVQYGTLSDGATQGLKLGLGSGCNGAIADCAKASSATFHELSSSWTPQWQSLISYWKMNEPVWQSLAGEVVDSKGINHGVRAGEATTTLSDRFGVGVGLFDGAGDFADIGTDASLNPTVALTVSAWVKRSAPLADYSGIFSSTKDAANEGGYLLSGNFRDKIQFAIRSNGDWYTAESDLAIDLGQWYLATGTWDGSTIKLYINGKLQALTATASSISYPATVGQNHFIGKYADGVFERSWPGMIDDLAIWSSALSALEIQTIYERQRSGYSGIYTSRVMNAGLNSTWSTLSWLTALPFGKELPDYANGTVQNETSANYSSLVGSSGLLNDNDLMTDITGLWHLNNSFEDSAGSGITLNNFNVVKFSNSVKKLGPTSTEFDGTLSFLEYSGTAYNLTTSVTLSIWVYLTALPPASHGSGLIVNGTNLVNDGAYELLAINNLGVPYVWFRTASTNPTTSVSPVPLQLKTWTHIVATYDGTNAKIYMDGSLTDSQPRTGPIVSNSTCLRLGMRCDGAESPLGGNLDEAAIWGRALHSDEVKQLYQRGISRLKFQVRSCEASDPTCNLAAWKGPDGTSSTYFSELNNKVTINGASLVSPMAPAISFSNFLSPPSANQYFQYRAIFESDTAITTTMPELKSVTVDPTHYNIGSTSVYGMNGANFSELTTFNVTLGAGNCSKEIGYNLSIDKLNWKYWSGTAWVTTNNTAAQSNSAEIIQSNLAAFPSQVGRGTVYVKAYLNSDGLSKCELENIRIGGTR